MVNKLMGSKMLLKKASCLFNAGLIMRLGNLANPMQAVLRILTCNFASTDLEYLKGPAVIIVFPTTQLIIRHRLP